jgi:hypothetical protein
MSLCNRIKNEHIFPFWNNITQNCFDTNWKKYFKLINTLTFVDIVFRTRQPFFDPSRGFFSLDYTCASIYYLAPPSDFVCLVRETRFWCVLLGPAQGLRPSSAAAKTE